MVVVVVETMQQPSDEAVGGFEGGYFCCHERRTKQRGLNNTMIIMRQRIDGCVGRAGRRRHSDLNGVTEEMNKTFFPCFSDRTEARRGSSDAAAFFSHLSWLFIAKKICLFRPKSEAQGHPAFTIKLSKQHEGFTLKELNETEWKTDKK